MVTQTDETKKKISETLRNKFGRTCVRCGERYVRDAGIFEWIVKYCPACRTKCLGCEKQIPATGRYCMSCKKNHLAVDELPFDKLWNNDVRKKRLVKIFGHRCSRCLLTEWLGKPISLELDHTDGNRRNSVQENCRLLCPNCHSQTVTWKWRNRSIMKKP